MLEPPAPQTGQLSSVKRKYPALLFQRKAGCFFEITRLHLLCLPAVHPDFSIGK